MTWRLKDEEVSNVLNLSGIERYKYLVKKVTDEETVWSLWEPGGWALAADDEGHELVPIWPHEHYARICAKGEWQNYSPRAIELGAWLERWLPGIHKDSRSIAVFPTPSQKGVVVAPSELSDHLHAELSNYE